MPGHLSRSQTVDRSGISNTIDRRVDIGIGSAKGQAVGQFGQIELGVDFNALGSDRLQIMALAIRPVRPDKAAPRKNARRL